MAFRSTGANAKVERLRAMRASKQWVDGRFSNPLPERMNLWHVLQRMLHRSKHVRPTSAMPTHATDPALFQTPPADGLRVTWLGHSTNFVEIDGVRILTDPMWSPRASPHPGMGPRRFFEPPLALERVPLPDVVLLSHDHYDHLDEATIRAMNTWDTRFACPLGVGAHLEAWGVPLDRILELDWWDSFTVKGLDIVCTPARHFSGRGLFNRRSTLWSSWSLVGPSHRVFFSGDSALFGGFAEIGERFGPFDACLMETGSYDPSWPDVHIGPEQAVKAVQALRGKLYVPVHWGTFNLGTHGWTEPVERLLVAAAAAGIPVCVPKPGASVEPANPPRVERWWPDLPWQGVKEAPVVSTGLGR